MSDVPPNGDEFWSVEQILWEELQLQEDIEDEQLEMAMEEEIIDQSVSRSPRELTLQ